MSGQYAHGAEGPVVRSAVPEPVESELVEPGGRTGAFDNPLGEQVADERRELEAVAAHPKRAEQALGARHGVDNRMSVDRVVIDAGPAAKDGSPVEEGHAAACGGAIPLNLFVGHTALITIRIDIQIGGHGAKLADQSRVGPGQEIGVGVDVQYDRVSIHLGRWSADQGHGVTRERNRQLVTEVLQEPHSPGAGRIDDGIGRDVAMTRVQSGNATGFDDDLVDRHPFADLDSERSGRGGEGVIRLDGIGDSGRWLVADRRAVACLHARIDRRYLVRSEQGSFDAELLVHGDVGANTGFCFGAGGQEHADRQIATAPLVVVGPAPEDCQRIACQRGGFGVRVVLPNHAAALPGRARADMRALEDQRPLAALGKVRGDARADDTSSDDHDAVRRSHRGDSSWTPDAATRNRIPIRSPFPTDSISGAPDFRLIARAIANPAGSTRARATGATITGASSSAVMPRTICRASSRALDSAYPDLPCSENRNSPTPPTRTMRPICPFRLRNSVARSVVSRST